MTQTPVTLPADTVAPSREIAALKNMSFDELINNLVSDLVRFAISLAIATAALAITYHTIFLIC